MAKKGLSLQLVLCPHSSIHSFSIIYLFPVLKLFYHNIFAVYNFRYVHNFTYNLFNMILSSFSSSFLFYFLINYLHLFHTYSLKCIK